jgi:hypothetical protein
MVLFTYSLLNNVVSSSDYIVSNCKVTNERLNGCGRGQIPAFAWMVWGTTQIPSQHSSIPAKNQTKHFPNTSQKHYRLSQLMMMVVMTFITYIGY